MSAELQHCRSCGAPVYWLRNGATGASAPIDAHPSAQGNCLLALADGASGSYTLVPAASRPAYAGTLHTSHFATCPDAQRWKHAKHAAKGAKP